MDKKGYLNLFKDADENTLVKLWEDIELSISIDYPIETEEFFPPNIWSKLEKNNINGVRFLFKGLTENSEKKNIIIIPKDFSGEIPDFNTIYFVIDGKNKFRELQHKDFLGMIMSLGIKREIFGDLIVEENLCYGIIHGEKFSLIKDNLEKVSNVSVKIKTCEEKDVPSINFKEIGLTVTSLRFDNVVSELTNLSRQKAVDEIETGNVMLNYVVQKEKSTSVKEGDIITVRKVGKFLFFKENGENKKGKVKSIFKKFV